MSVRFVHKSELLRPENVRHCESDEFVQVQVIEKRKGSERRLELERVVPDIAAALTQISRNMLQLAEMVVDVELQIEKLAPKPRKKARKK